MIAAFALALLVGAPIPEGDSTFAFLRLRPLLGLAVDNRPSGAAWLDLGVQIDIPYAALRYEHSFPVWWDTRDDFSMAEGQCLPEHEGTRDALALGYQATLRYGWLGAGAGWSWATLDTLAYTYDEREIRIRKADGSFEPDANGATLVEGWVWKERLHESAPFLYLDAGVTKRFFSMGYRASFNRRSFRLGTSLQLAFTLL